MTCTIQNGLFGLVSERVYATQNLLSVCCNVSMFRQNNNRIGYFRVRTYMMTAAIHGNSGLTNIFPLWFPYVRFDFCFSAWSVHNTDFHSVYTDIEWLDFWSARRNTFRSIYEIAFCITCRLITIYGKNDIIISPIRIIFGRF